MSGKRGLLRYEKGSYPVTQLSAAKLLKSVRSSLLNQEAYLR